MSLRRAMSDSSISLQAHHIYLLLNCRSLSTTAHIPQGGRASGQRGVGESLLRMRMPMESGVRTAYALHGNEVKVLHKGGLRHNRLVCASAFAAAGTAAIAGSAADAQRVVRGEAAAGLLVHVVGPAVHVHQGGAAGQGAVREHGAHLPVLVHQLQHPQQARPPSAAAAAAVVCIAEVTVISCGTGSDAVSAATCASVAAVAAVTSAAAAADGDVGAFAAGRSATVGIAGS